MNGETATAMLSSPIHPNGVKGLPSRVDKVFRLARLPYSPETLRAICEDPHTFRDHLNAASFKKAVGCLAFFLMHVHCETWETIAAGDLYARYLDFAERWATPPAIAAQFGRELGRWYRLQHGVRIGKGERRNGQGTEYFYRGIACSSDELATEDPRYSGRGLLNLDVHVPGCTCLTCWSRQPARAPRKTAARCSDDYCRQVAHDPRQYRAYLKGEPEALAAALAFMHMRLDVDADGAVRVVQVYNTYGEFCLTNDHPALSRAQFGRQVFDFLRSRRVSPQIGRPRYQGRRERSYVGITLRPVQ